MAGRRLKKSALAGRRPARECGAALLIFMILLVTAALTYLVNQLTPEVIEARRTERTNQSLLLAREALIGYATQYREQQRLTGGTLDAMYGYLPLPDFGETFNQNTAFGHPCNTEGCAKFNATGLAGNTVLVGRFPWRTVGTGPLRDGHGECLWYAVSATHRSVSSSATSMNWDTLAAPDILIGSGRPDLNALNAHDRPVAVIFSPGAAFDDGRTASADAPECGGNYDPSHYVDPNLNNAQPAQPVTSGKFFETLRRSSVSVPGAAAKPVPSFPDEINDMLQKVADCARDQVAAGSIGGNGKVNDTCSIALDPFGPRGYYANFRDQVFVATCPGCTLTIDNAAQACDGVVLFGNQRGGGQNRRDAGEQNSAANYLEGDNLTSYEGGGATYAGPGWFGNVRASTANPPDVTRCTSAGNWIVSPECQTVNQDILRCVPAGASLTSVQSATLTAQGFGQLTQYDAATRTLSLGQVGAQQSNLSTPAASYGLFGCAWQPQTHAAGNGVRAYFKYKIWDTGTVGDGFVFALVDGDANLPTACGSARQHLGYSGRNDSTLPLAAPKVGIEFDTSRNYRLPTGFEPSYNGAFPSYLSALNNGRTDPNYHNAGHLGIVYWGGEIPISTGRACVSSADCTYPEYCNTTDNICYLNPEEDDNVHGRPALAAVAARPPPKNPKAEVTLPTPPAGVYELTPDSSVTKYLPYTPEPIGVHVRIEFTRTQPRSVDALADGNVNVAAAPPANIDDFALVAGSRVLLKGQVAGTENGVWEISGGAWVRAAAENAAGDIPFGTVWTVLNGTNYKNTFWRFDTPGGFNPPTSSNTFTKIPVITRLANAKPVRVVATSNQALTGLPTIDGVSVQVGDRVLLTAQTEGRRNGVWVATAGAWYRATTEDQQAEMPSGSAWIVREGDGNAWTYWRLDNTDNFILDTTALIINKLTAPWKAVATSNVTLSGLQTIGGVALAAHDWVLVAGQTTAAENGVYKVLGIAWERIPMYQESYDTRVWTQKEGVYADRIANMKLVSRAMADLDPSHIAGVGDTATFYSPRMNACTGNYECPSGQWCGIDNFCYRPALTTLRLGFTNGQGTRDQDIDITDFVTTWLP